LSCLTDSSVHSSAEVSGGYIQVAIIGAHFEEHIIQAGERNHQGKGNVLLFPGAHEFRQT
jgi:hypothetical protein